MSGYIRTDISSWWKSECFLIPTISISKWAKGFEINLHILWLIIYEAYATISYIKEEEYES